MTNQPNKQTPPPAPPAPPNTTTAPHVAATAAPAKNAKEEVRELVKELLTIASAIPTPGVTDSQAHGKALNGIAVRLQKLSDTL